MIAIGLVFLIMNCRKDTQVKKTKTPQQSIATATIEAPTPEPVANTATQQDLSVIVRDKGASIVMAPILSKQPTIVTESAVRAMQKTNKQ